MLEVKHLRKTYKTKNGAVTKALDDVSLTFAETGMVFILGKSGSGKSTLLNVCGGLDKADSGEIIIKGKSSSEFSGQDFDSYRNTYVGFVFQEYNILEEFTVEENIALALELQNKKRDKAAIEKILEDVDMTSFASRKPNTLSGGQKQRVAIARALVKEPEIIMADEPTGALDSKTGQQVFDTLKKLSQTKLVLVVSHDREFAEQYGDRIIELKDGKIISDQTRAESGEGARNVRFFGTNTVSVQNGAELTDEDMQSIRSFLKKAGGAAVISTSREHITEMKRDLPEMSIGAFEDIAEQPQSKSYPQQKLIRSHLPIKHAVRMGAGSLKTKPVRLVFTIFLSVIAFILFGLASTLMLFDGRAVTKETLTNSGDDMIVLSKAYYQKYSTYEGDKLEYEDEYKERTEYTYDEFKQIRDKYAGSIAAVDASISISDVSMPNTVSQFYSSYLDGFIVTDPSLQYTFGKAPEALDEVAVSDFILNGLTADKTEVKMYSGKNNQTMETVNVQAAADIIYSDSNKRMIRMGDGYFKVTGVFKGMTVPSEYAELKDAADKGLQFNGDYSLTWQWQQTRNNGLYARLAVTEEFVKLYVEDRPSDDNNFDAYKYFDNSYYFSRVGYETQEGYISGRYINMMAKYEERDGLEPLEVFDYNGSKLDKLADGSVAVTSRVYAELLADSMHNLMWWNTEKNPEASAAAQQKYDEWRSQTEKKFRDEYTAKHPEPQWKDYEGIEGGNNNYNNDWNDWYNDCENYVYENLNKIDPINSLSLVHNNEVTKPTEVKPILKNSYEFATELFGGAPTCIMYNEFNGEKRTVKLDAYFFSSVTDVMYLSDDLYDVFFVTDPYNNNWHTEYSTKYVKPEGAYISAIFVPSSASAIDELVDYTYKRGDDDSTASIHNGVMSQLEFVIDMADMLELGFFIAGLVLALFAFLLMFNFISASITAKKKEIGILRAIGARTLDVFKIFLAEAFIIAAICFVISTLGTLGLCILLNTTIVGETAVKVSLFVFGPVSVLMILGIALLTSLISTVIPVALYSRKPPIASIRAL